MKITKILTGILFLFLILQINMYQIRGEQDTNTLSLDISKFTSDVQGFVIANNHFWILGSNETSNNPDIVNVLYKINTNGDLVDSFFLLEGSQPNPFDDFFSYTGLAFDGTDFLIYSGLWIGNSNENIVFRYNTEGEFQDFTIIPLTNPNLDRNVAFGDGLLWVQGGDKIDSIDLESQQFSDRLDHPGLGGVIAVEDIFWGGNQLWIQYGNDNDRILIEYDYRNDDVISRYDVNRNLVIHDIYYDSETFWIIQETNNLLSISTFEPTKSSNESNNLIFTGIISLFAITILGYSLRALWLKKNQFIPLPKSQIKILKDIFQSQTSLYYVLISQSVFKDKSVENEVRNGIPENLLKFKFLLHPVRLSLTKLLFENMELSSIELREIVEIPWNDYHTHIKALEKREYVHVTKKFIDGSKRQVVTLTPHGTSQFKILIDLLHLFLDNSIEYSSYINNAINLKNEFSEDVDILYPNS